MRNHEHYIDRTAGEAIRRTCRSRKKKDKPWGVHNRHTWGDRLTYRIGEVMAMKQL